MHVVLELYCFIDRLSIVTCMLYVSMYIEHRYGSIFYSIISEFIDVNLQSDMYSLCISNKYISCIYIIIEPS